MSLHTESDRKKTQRTSQLRFYMKCLFPLCINCVCVCVFNEHVSYVLSLSHYAPQNSSIPKGSQALALVSISNIYNILCGVPAPKQREWEKSSNQELQYYAEI